MAVLTVTDADDGRVVSARAGDDVVVRLPENPTTGCRWQVDRLEGSVRHVSDSFTLDPDVRIGSGGVREFTFRADAPGAARLQLKRWQPWEGKRSVDATFAIDITIAG